MVDLGKVSEQAKALVNQTKAIGGDKTKIDTLQEVNILSNALAGTCDESDRAYIQGAIDSFEKTPAKNKKPEAGAKKGKSAPAKNPPAVNNQNKANGNGNVQVSGNGNTVIVSPQANFNTPDSGGNCSASPAKSSSVKTQPKLKPLTPREAKDARENGEDVADALIGYTTDAEQYQVKAILAKVDKRNVMEFLRGYMSNNGLSDVVVDKRFFNQMRTENGFKENQNLMHRMANHLQNYFTEKYGANAKVAKEVAIICLESTFTDEETRKLDDIVDRELSKTAP